MLFGRAPRRFLLTSEVKCAHLHGTQVARPIPSYQVYKGTVFQLVDQAVDFVLSKISLTVGERAETVQAPVAYEIPKEVVTEAIVNAVAHRDYTDNSSVQVTLFADRLEVMNSGRLPPTLTVEMLRVAHQSLPANPLIAESMYLLRYIEKIGYRDGGHDTALRAGGPSRARGRGGCWLHNAGLETGQAGEAVWSCSVSHSRIPELRRKTYPGRPRHRPRNRRNSPRRSVSRQMPCLRGSASSPCCEAIRR